MADEVRGGYFIRTQPFLFAGKSTSVGHYNAPLSEGIIDKRYAAVGAAMLAHALAEQPLLFAMGMGGADRPLPRMLRAMGWSILETPVLFPGSERQAISAQCRALARPAGAPR